MPKTDKFDVDYRDANTVEIHMENQNTLVLTKDDVEEIMQGFIDNFPLYFHDHPVFDIMDALHAQEQ